MLKDDNTFIQELFARLKSPTTSQESKKNLVGFDTISYHLLLSIIGVPFIWAIIG